MLQAFWTNDQNLEYISQVLICFSAIVLSKKETCSTSVLGFWPVGKDWNWSFSYVVKDSCVLSGEVKHLPLNCKYHECVKRKEKVHIEYHFESVTILCAFLFAQIRLTQVQ